MPRRRRILAALSLAFLLATSGCSLSAALVHDAAPATVEDRVVRAAGYEHVHTTDLSLGGEVGVDGVEAVRVRGWLATYRLADAGLRTPRLYVVSTPRLAVGGRSANPLAHLSDRQLLQRVLDWVLIDYNLRKIELVDNGTVRMLGRETELLTYRGDSRPGADADLETTGYAHLATVEHGDDVVVAVAVHSTRTNQRGRIARMLGAIEHAGRG